MSDDISHVDFPTFSGFFGSSVMATTPVRPGAAKKEPESTPVLDRERFLSDVAWWGYDNLFPQNVIKDIEASSLVASVLERKVDMLISGGVSYGIPEYDPSLNVEVIKPLHIPEIDDWLEGSNFSLFAAEALHDRYTFYNFFPEYIMTRGKNRVHRIECKDASNVRLGRMDDKGNITRAYVANWEYGSTLGDIDIVLTALDPHRRVAQQMIELNKPRYILPVREVKNGRFYYALSPWNGLRVSGWLEVAKRIPWLKMQILKNLMHLRYHIEFASSYWSNKYKDWDQKTEQQKLDTMTEEVRRFDNWAKGDHGQGGVYWSLKMESPHSKELRSMVTINEMKMNLPDGAYLQDSQEADFIICRDLGLKPSLHGISPSKSGSSPGSGSEDRISWTNHILAQKRHADAVLDVLKPVQKINGWDPRIKFTFNNYYAATLDRTREVGTINNNTPL